MTTKLDEILMDAAEKSMAELKSVDPDFLNASEHTGTMISKVLMSFLYFDSDGEEKIMSVHTENLAFWERRAFAQSELDYILIKGIKQQLWEDR